MVAIINHLLTFGIEENKYDLILTVLPSTCIQMIFLPKNNNILLPFYVTTCVQRLNQQVSTIFLYDICKSRVFFHIVGGLSVPIRPITSQGMDKPLKSLKQHKRTVTTKCTREDPQKWECTTFFKPTSQPACLQVYIINFPGHNFTFTYKKAKNICRCYSRQGCCLFIIIIKIPNYKALLISFFF